MVRSQLPAQLVNLLRWNLSLYCSISSVLSIFKYNLGKTNDKFITFQSFLSSDIVPTSSKESDELLYTVLVARYGPQSVNLLRWNLSQNCNIFSVLSIFKYNVGKTNDKFITSQ